MTYMYSPPPPHMTYMHLPPHMPYSESGSVHVYAIAWFPSMSIDATHIRMYTDVT
jgi:hypothetical protein